MFFHFLFGRQEMLANYCATAARRRLPASAFGQAKRSAGNQVVDKAKGPIGQDGRHELWREGIYDHDNEPK